MMQLLSLKIHLANNSICIATLQRKAGSSITKEIILQETLHKSSAQLLESMRGSTKNVIHPGLPVNEATLERDIIDQLYESAFQNPIGEAIQTQLQNDDITLLIHSPDPKVRNLPWEMLTERLGGFGTGQKHRLSIVRTICATWDEFNATETIPPSATPLKLLFVTALPENISERSKELQIEDEQRKLIEAIGDLEATGTRQPRMVVEFLDVASLEEITAALKARRHDILHVSGHGKFNESVKQSVLHLENEDGDHLETEGKVFAEALRGHSSLRLVVLSACETAVMDAESCVVEAVAAIGVPAVVGMRFSVSDETAKVFTTHFYQQLANGTTVADALSVVRNELWEREQKWRKHNPDEYRLPEYFIPVLYSNGAVQSLMNPSLPYQFPSDFYPAEADGKRRIGAGFIGRKRPLIQMRKAFRANRHVCIAGMGGMGKTTLAEAFAANYENGAYYPIIWRGGTEINEFGILNRIVLEHGRRHRGAELKTLRAVIENGEMPVLNRLHYVIQKCLVGERTILVFDNFEDLQDLSGVEGSRGIVSEGLREFLGYLLAHAPAGCHLLFTTRYRIEGLSSSVETIDLDKLSPAEQYRWMNYSRELRFIPAVDRLAIYRRLDGLPRAFQFLEALARNKKGFDWGDLEAGLGKVEARAFEGLMLGRIYGLLSAELQQVFLVASVFLTRTPIAALIEVTQDAEIDQKLKFLNNWSILSWEPKKSSFQISSMIPKWIIDNNLLTQDERCRIAILAGNYFSRSKAIGDLRLAIRYYGIAEDWVKLVEHSFRLLSILEGNGMFSEAIEVCSMILEKVQDDRSKGVAMNTLGRMLLYETKYSSALPILEQSLNIIMKVGDEKLLGSIYHNLAEIARANENNGLALMLLEQSLELGYSAGDWEGAGMVLNLLSQIHQEIGDASGARDCLEKSRKIFQKIGNKKGLAVVLCNLGQLHSDQMDFVTALPMLEECLHICNEIGDKQGAMSALNNLGNIYGNKNQLELALTCFESSLKISIEIGDKSGQVYGFHNIGAVWFEIQDFEIAAPYLIQAHFSARRRGIPITRSTTRFLQGLLEHISASRFQEILTNLDLENL